MHFLSITYIWLAASAILLAALYFWRRHSKRVRVPALFQWDVKEEQPNAGRSWRLTRLPLTYYLEALAIVLFALAAAMPFFLSREEYPPLVVVLDNSFSMQAVDSRGRSVKELSVPDIEKAVSRFPGRKVHWILAGAIPQKVDAENTDAMGLWSCNAIASDIMSALVMARQLCSGGEILVVTDRPPMEKGIKDVHWVSHGRARPNVAFVNARRSGGSVLLELYNASDSEVAAVVKETGNGGESAALSVAVPSKELKKIDFKLQNPERLARFSLEAPDDALAMDNSAVLLPDARPPLSYRLGEGLSEQQENILRKTLMRNPEYVSIGERELAIGGASMGEGGFHRLVWHGGGKAVSTAPMTIRPDYQRLLGGLSFSDVIWPSDPALELPGTVLLYQGDTQLLSVARRGPYIDIHMNLNESAGNLLKHALWPSLFWNISDFLRSQRYSPDRVNIRCGDMVRVPNPRKEKIAADGKEVINNYPDAYIIFDEPGMHNINNWQIAVNPFDKEESDLSAASSCDIRPDASFNPIAHSIRRQLAFAFMLAALLVLALHWQISTRRR